MNSTPGMSPTSLCSSLPTIQVRRVCGHVPCSVRTSGTTCVTSPSAEVRNRHSDCGAWMAENAVCGMRAAKLAMMMQAQVQPTPDGLIVFDPDAAAQAAFDPDWFEQIGRASCRERV